MPEGGSPQSSPESNIPDTKPVAKTVEQLKKEQEMEREKEERRVEDEKEELRFSVLKGVVADIYRLETSINTTREELHNAQGKRNDWMPKPGDAGVKRPDNYEEALKKAQAEVTRLEAELKKLEAELLKKRDMEKNVRSMATTYETIVKGRTEILAEDFKHIIWYPSSRLGDPFEYSAKERKENGIAREKVAGKENEYRYWRILEVEGNTRQRLYAPGQKPEEENPLRRPAEPEEEKNAVTFISVFNSPREDWEKGITLLLKERKGRDALWQFVQQKQLQNNADLFAFQIAVLQGILKNDKNLAEDVKKELKKMILDPIQLQAANEKMMMLAKAGPEIFDWALTTALDAKEQNQNPLSSIDVSLLSLDISQNKDAIALLKKRYETEKDPEKRNVFLTLLCTNDETFLQTINSDTLWEITRNSSETRVAILPLLAKRKDPRTVQLLEEVLNDHWELSQPAILAFKKSILTTVTELKDNPGIDQEKLAQTLLEVLEKDEMGISLIEPILVRALVGLGKKQQITKWKFWGILDLNDQELDNQLLADIDRLETLNQRIADMNARKIGPGQNIFGGRNNARLPFNNANNALPVPNNPINAQQLLANLPNIARNEIERIVDNRLMDDVDLLQLQNIAFINPQIRDDIEKAVVDAYTKFAWDDAIIDEVFGNAVMTIDQKILEKELTTRFTDVLRKANQDLALAPQWAKTISNDKDARDTMRQILEARALIEVMENKNPALINKMIAHLNVRMPGAKIGLRGLKDENWLEWFINKDFDRQNGPTSAQLQNVYSSIPAVIKAIPVLTAIPAAIIEGFAKKPEGDEKKEETAHPLKSLMQNTEMIEEGNVRLYKGKIGEYNVMIAESGSITHAYLETDKGEDIPLPSATVSGLNTVVLKRADESTVFYDLEKENVDNPYIGDKQKDDILKHIFAIDQKTKVVKSSQIKVLSDGMHLLFRGAPETIGSQHPLRVLGIITPDDTIDQTRAEEFQELFRFHMEEVRDWTFADMEALTKLWDQKGSFVFAPLVVLRGQSPSDGLLS